MSARLKTWLEKLDDFLERNRRYIRPPAFILFLFVAGVEVYLLIVSIATAYVLAIAVGIPTIQLLTGIVSAISAGASASAAFLIYRNSIRGADIVMALEDLLEVETEYRIRRTPVTQIPTGATQTNRTH